MICEEFEHTNPIVYDCTGFRLPTEHEWEYAARAGTTTAFYSGDFSEGTTHDSAHDSVIDPIAWYIGSISVAAPHPVGQKQPNSWGLFDILGNVPVWTNSPAHKTHYGPDRLVDPDGTLDTHRYRSMRGSSFQSFPREVRAAQRSDYWITYPWPGLRLVRTGSQTPNRLPGSPNVPSAIGKMLNVIQ